MPELPSIELARLADAPTIAASSRLHVEQGLGWRWTPRAVAREIQRRDTEVIVARREDRLAGFAIMRFEDDEAHLFLLAVSPRERRQGLGSRLLEFLEQEARAAGIGQIRLEVRSENREARTFYRRLGYREVRVVPGYYQGLEHAVVMTRTLLPQRV